MTQATDHLNPGTLSAYIDSELPPEESQSIQKHLVVCHVCALEVLSAIQIKSATSRAGHRHALAPEVLARLMPQSRSTQASQPAESRFRRFTAVWVMLAACLLAAASLIAWRHIRRANTLSGELLDQHLATLSNGAFPEVVSTDRHTVKPWFEGKLPFSFNLPAALPAGTVLQGGDVTYLDGRPAALLLFTIQKHRVSVILTQRAESGTVRTGMRSGFAIHEATTRDLRFIAVSDVDQVALDQLLSSLVRAQLPD